MAIEWNSSHNNRTVLITEGKQNRVQCQRGSWPQVHSFNSLQSLIKQDLTKSSKLFPKLDLSMFTLL